MTSILIHTYILYGPPTNIDCDRNQFEISGVTRNILTTEGIIVTGVTIGLYVPGSSYPSKVTCDFSNDFGSTSFDCLLKGRYNIIHNYYFT